MPRAIPRLLATGVLLTLTGLLGLALTVGRTATAPTLRWFFVLCYGAGALCLIAAGLWWAIRWTRRRDR